MQLVQIYQCLCDATRLRILNLLLEGPLCVCHLQSILGESQVKVSKHLAYLKRHRLVEAERQGHWMVYRITTEPSLALTENLACLQDCTREDPVFGVDRERRATVIGQLDDTGPLACCPPHPSTAVRRRRAPAQSSANSESP